MADRSEHAVSRRGLFRALAREAQVVAGTLKGGQGFSLARLAELPDAQLARLVPAVNPDYAIEVRDQDVWARHLHSGDEVRLFGLERENTAAFNLFNGQTTLGMAGRLLAGQLDWDEGRAFAHVRALFVRLAAQMVCVPVNPLG